MANVSLKHIYKVYPNGTKAVNDFNLQIEDKEFVVFVGPSGCGKSTTLRMIAGLEDISAGELKIGGAVVNDTEPKDRDIAMVFQNYALYPHMTIYENIAFGLRMHKVADVKRDGEGRPVLDKQGNTIPVMRKYGKQELDQKVYEAAQILGITDYLKRKPKEMSGGQRQRVALGRAIVRRPKVMLLDEPLSNLDAKLRTQMRSEIVKLHNKLNTTFIYVTHDQVEAMTMGTRIVVMKDGFIRQTDTPKNLYMYPADKFVAGFIGTPQMNFFKGFLNREGGKVTVKFDNTPAQVDLPYPMLQKIPPRYLNGQTPVCIGLRAENISLDPEKVKASPTVVDVRVDHLEELGTETLVYGNLDADGVEAPVIIKAAGFREYEYGQTVKAAFDFSAAHFFDCDTEKSIMPRVPQYNYAGCKIAGGRISFFGVGLPLPPALDRGDGEGELLIPPDAVVFGGDIPAKIDGCEKIGDKYLVWLDVNGGRLYALSDTARGAGNVNIGLDFKKLTLKFEGRTVEPMPLTNGFCGTFTVKTSVEKVDKKNKKTPHYYININGKEFEAPEEVYRKMFAATPGRKVFNSTYRYEWSPYDMAISEGGIEAQVVDILDYGAEKFIKCTAYGETLYVNAQAPVGSEIYLAPDVSKVCVTESERQIRIV